MSAFNSDDVDEMKNPPELATAPKCSTKKYVTVPGVARDKLRQEDYWGSPSWWASYAGRTHVEGISDAGLPTLDRRLRSPRVLGLGNLP